MDLHVVIGTQSFGTPALLPGLALKPTRYGWMALGGPDLAVVEAEGEPRALWSLLNTLRAPVEIRDARDRAVWWGYVAEVTVTVGNVEVGISLQQMTNRVAVVYSYIEPGSNTVGTRATTAWVQDDDSVALYGTKERRNSRDGCSSETAEARRDAILERLRYTIPQIRVLTGRGQRKATLRCAGWWHTLDWTYYSRSAGRVEHADGAANQALGQAAGNAKIAQSFVLAGSEAWDALTVAVQLSKTGEPADTVYVDLCADSGGAAGSVLATGEVDGADVGETTDWVTLTLDTEVPLALSTTYWIVLRRSGAVDAEAYYSVTVDEGLGYAGGLLRLWDGSTWALRDPDADLVFRVSGVEETTAQIVALGDAEGQFLTEIDIVTASGVRSNQYRDGDTTALAELETLLLDGTSAGKRLLATVTQARELRVYAEPSPDTIGLQIGADGRPRDAFGAAAEAHTCPVAVWCELVDVLPATVNMGALMNPSPFFIERAEYNVERQTWTPESRDMPSPWEIGQMVEL